MCHNSLCWLKENRMSETKTIGKEYTTLELIRFVSSPVLTQFALSLLQTLDDGLFLSRYVGQNALAAFSIAFPVFMVINALSELFCGVNVLCATKMGAKKNEEANRSFTAVVLVALGTGLLCTALLKIFEDPIIYGLGATDVLYPYLKDFYRIAGWYLPMMMVQALFSRFYVTAGKPQYAMVTMLMSAGCNFFFDWLFIARLQWGMSGAAFANMFGHIAVLIFGLIFYNSKNAEVRFATPEKNVLPLLKQCFKLGFPQFFTCIAIAVNGYIANQILLHYGNEEGVSAYTIVNNIQFMFTSGLFGLSGAVCPLISYAFGEQNRQKIRRIIIQVIRLTAGLTVIIIATYLLAKNFMLSIYLKSDASANVRSMADYGLTVAPLAFIFFGFNVLTIDTFVALNNSRTSTILTALENFIFSNLTVIALPWIFGLKGIWFAFACSETLTFIFTVLFIIQNRKRYVE